MSSQNLLILGYGMQGKAALYDCLQHGDFDHIVVADGMPDFPESMGRDLNQKGEIVEIPGLEIFASENMHIIDDKNTGGPLECFSNGNSARYAEEFGLSGKVNQNGFPCPGSPGFDFT